MNALRLLAVPAVLALLAGPASAQPHDVKAVLGATSGLDATSSRSPIGFTPPSAESVGDYARALGAVQVSARFHSAKDTSTSLVTVHEGADVAFDARFSKKNGDAAATLDGLTLTAKGVDGPLGTTLQGAEIHADGSMTVKLNSWIPEIKVDGIERQPDGEITLKGPWYLSPLSITKDGDIVIGQKDSAIGEKFGRLKIGHIDPRLLVHWPPRVDDIAAIAARPDPNDPLVAELKTVAKSSAGGLSWDVNATADGLPVTVEGAPLKSKETLHVHGAAVLGDGHLKTTGSDNVVNVELVPASQKLGDANAGLTLTKGDVKLDGAYRLDLPLDDVSHLLVAFDGTAAYSLSGDDLHVTLPNKGKVTIAHADLSRTGAVHAEANGADTSFRLDDSRYNFTARGPIGIEKLGPISKLELDGELRSKGLARIGTNGVLALKGDLGGTFVVKNGGTLNRLDLKPGFYARTLKPGAKLDVNLDEIAGALTLPLDGRAPSFNGADAHGRVALHGDLGDVTVKKNGLDLAAPDVRADVTAAGRVSANGPSVSGDGDVKVGLGLPKGARVTASTGPARVSTTINPGAHVDATAHVSRAPSAPGAADPEIVLTKTGLNIRKGPSASSDRVGLAPRGTRLTVLERSGDWVKVKAPDGTVGWVNSKYTTGSAGAPSGAPTIVNGRITGELGASNGTLDANGAHADLRDQLAAKVNGPLKATIGSDGAVNATGTKLSVPVRIDIKKGTKISFGGHTVTLTDDGAYAIFTGEIALDASGQPKAQRLSNVDVQLNLGGASLGWFHLPDFGKVRFRGEVTFGPGGVKIHGDTGIKLGSWQIADIAF